MELFQELLLPFQFAFMQKAFVITVLVSVPMAILSCYLVLKGWSLMGDAISHSILPGGRNSLCIEHSTGNWCVYSRDVLRNGHRVFKRKQQN